MDEKVTRGVRRLFNNSNGTCTKLEFDHPMQWTQVLKRFNCHGNLRAFRRAVPSCQRRCWPCVLRATVVATSSASRRTCGQRWPWGARARSQWPSGSAGNADDRSWDRLRLRPLMRTSEDADWERPGEWPHLSCDIWTTMRPQSSDNIICRNITCQQYISVSHGQSINTTTNNHNNYPLVATEKLLTFYYGLLLFVSQLLLLSMIYI